MFALIEGSKSKKINGFVKEVRVTWIVFLNKISLAFHSLKKVSKTWIEKMLNFLYNNNSICFSITTTLSAAIFIQHLVWNRYAVIQIAPFDQLNKILAHTYRSALLSTHVVLHCLVFCCLYSLLATFQSKKIEGTNNFLEELSILVKNW